MAYWLVKSEPFKYSWEQFVKDKSTFWDGVRNYQARNNLQAMKKGDKAFFYHSNEGLHIVGIAKIIKTAYPDPTIDDDRWVAVDLEPVKALAAPVTLAQMKAEKRLKEMGLIKQGRLSVSPVTAQEWEVVMELSKRNSREESKSDQTAEAAKKPAKKSTTKSTSKLAAKSAPKVPEHKVTKPKATKTKK